MEKFAGRRVVASRDQSAYIGVTGGDNSVKRRVTFSRGLKFLEPVKFGELESAVARVALRLPMA